MFKRIIITKIAFMCSLLLFPNNNVNVNQYSNIAHNGDLKNCNSYLLSSEYDVFGVDDRNVIAEIPNSKIKLYYVKKDQNGMYRGFVLQINGEKKYFRWENVDNPSYAPRLMLSDLDKDGKEELIIELCKGYGTGVYDGEVHVIKQGRFFHEISVENPSTILYKNVQVKELPEKFEIIFKDKKIILNKKKILTPPYSEVGIGWGNDNTRYDVKDNTLYAKVRVSVSTVNVGELIIKYEYKDRIFQMKSIDFFSYIN